MFNKMKHLKDLRSQAKTLQSALAQESITVDKKNVSITMNGNLEITEIKIPEDISSAEAANLVKDCVNDANKKAQKMMARKMQEMGGLPGLSQ
jgi:DNA-binding protein YbaB